MSKMPWFRFVFFVVIFVILQAGLVDRIAISDVKPDLLLILLVFFSIHGNTSQAIITSFVIGFAADISTGQTMGPQMLSFGLFGTMLAYLNRVISLNTMLHQAMTIFSVGLLAGIVTFFLVGLKLSFSDVSLNTELLAVSLYSAILGPFLFLPVGWIMHIKT